MVVYKISHKSFIYIIFIKYKPFFVVLKSIICHNILLLALANGTNLRFSTIYKKQIILYNSYRNTIIALSHREQSAI